jgi:hypothetical protein
MLLESNANTILGLASPDANYSAIWFADSTSPCRGELRQDSTSLYYRQAGVTQYQFRSADFRPSADNTKALGGSALRWSTVYAGTGTINTSDKREKSDARELSLAEQKVAKRLKKMVRAFRFNDAVENKGEGARIHFGLMAQEVGEAFTAEGLDPHRYALFCYDEWPEEKDASGKVIVEAGNRYGIRYDELFAFIISAL